jgi:pimeloyl-ACP methyl ester carboxylesterase
MNARIVSFALLSAAFATLFEPVGAQTAEPARMHVNEVNLSYIERGSGAPVILPHGGMGDYSSWQPQMEPFARHFRVIAYSRRYSFPNDNPSVLRTYSPWTDVDDLAALIRRLRLHDVRFVGQSAGALVALAFALKHPRTVMLPTANYFRQNELQHAMRTFVNGMAATNRFDRLSPEARAEAMRNVRSVEALCLSSEPFPVLSRADLSRLPVPALVVTGENTIQIHKLVDEELVRLLPTVKSVTIAAAGHGSPRENSLAFTEAVLEFFEADGRAN